MGLACHVCPRPKVNTNSFGGAKSAVLGGGTVAEMYSGGGRAKYSEKGSRLPLSGDTFREFATAVKP